MAFELDQGYLAASAFRFMDEVSSADIEHIYKTLVVGEETHHFERSEQMQLKF